MVRLSSLVHPFGLIRRSFAALINTDYPQTSGQLATIIVNPPRVWASLPIASTQGRRVTTVLRIQHYVLSLLIRMMQTLQDLLRGDFSDFYGHMLRS